MSGEASGGRKDGRMLQLRFHFGERDRDGDGPLDAAVMDACARRGVRAAALLRGVEGFGVKHRLRTDRLLSLSEDAPLVAAAVGEVEVVEALAEELRGMASEGLVGVEGVEVLDGRELGGDTATGTATTSAGEVAVPAADVPRDKEGGAPGGGTGGPPSDVVGSAEGDGLPRASGDATSEVVKATIWGPRTGPGSPHLAAVAALHRHGATAATVLIGVDGVFDGERRRARFIGANCGVPAMTVAVGERAAIDAGLADLDGTADLVTVEAVESSSRIERVSLHGAATRITLVTSEVAAHDSHPLYVELIQRLRREGAAGATALRGVWGFRGGGEPHGDRVLALRRDVPLLVETVDTPERAARWRELALGLAGDEDIAYSQEISSVLTLE